jgi:hypothetical protein
MASSVASKPETLASLSFAFSNFRQSSGLKRPTFPPALKHRALALLEQGIKHEEVGHACGVSKYTIALWKTQFVPRPRKLVVVPGKEIEDKSRNLMRSDDLQIGLNLNSVSFQLKSGIAFSVSREDAVWLVSKLGEVD